MLIVSGGVMRAEELGRLALPPLWRKATRNMILATQSMERALRRVPMLLERARGDLALVLGSNSGEIETSSDFILTFARSKMARPLLFQNSLHNATAGFASIHFGLSGPVFTLSDGERLPGECMALAKMLQAEGSCRAVMVTLVEAHKMMADSIGQSVAEAACTLIFASPELTGELGLKSVTADVDVLSQVCPARAAEAPLFDITTSQFFRAADDTQSI